MAVGAFDAEHLGDEDCGLNTQSWLRHKTKVDHKTAGRLTALGRRLHHFPALRTAALAGRLSGGQLAIITACVPERHFTRFAEHHAGIVADLEHLGIDGTKILMQSWLARADALDERAPTPERDNTVHHSTTLEGRGELRASVDPDRNATVAAALRIADPNDFDLTAPQRRAEALDTIFRYFLDHHHDPSNGRRHRPHVNIVMTYEQFVAGLGGTYLDTGGPVGHTECGVLACDSLLHRILIDGESAILDYGRATREWPADLFNAIVARDGGCRYPGCDLPSQYCDVHHLHAWEHDGDTSILNGLMLCRRHHRRMHHTAGLSAKLLPDGTLELTHPHGQFETTSPRGPTSPHLWDDRRQRRADGS